MNQLLQIILIMSFVGGMVTTYVLILNRIAFKSLSARWHYTMTKLVILFYILPLSVVVSYLNILCQRNEVSQNDIVTPLVAPELTIGDYNSSSQTMELGVGTEVSKNLDHVTNSMYSPIELILNMDRIFSVLIIIWLVGMVAFAIRYVVSYIIINKKILKNSHVINDIDILDIISTLKKEEGIRCKIRIMESNILNTPVLMGIFKPSIIIPKNMFSKEQLYFVIKHELIHYKQKDIFFKVLFLISASLHWFNPFIYKLLKSFNFWSELNCDEKLILNLSKIQIKEYGLILLRPQEFKNKNINTYVVCLAQNNKFLERRIKMLFNKRNKTKALTTLSVTAGLSVMGLGVITSSGFSMDVMATESPSNRVGVPEGTTVIYASNYEGTIVIDGSSYYVEPFSEEQRGINKFLNEAERGEYRVIHRRQNSPYAEYMDNFTHYNYSINNSDDIEVVKRYVEGATANMLFPSYIPEGFRLASSFTEYGHLDETFDRNIQPYSVSYDEFGNSLVTYKLGINNENITNYNMTLLGSDTGDLDTLYDKDDSFFGSEGAIMSIGYQVMSDQVKEDLWDYMLLVNSGLYSEIEVEGLHQAIYRIGESDRGEAYNSIEFIGIVEIEPTAFMNLQDALGEKGNKDSIEHKTWATVRIAAVGDEVNNIDLEMVKRMAEGLVLIN